jgi:hypothetical protein
MTDAQIKHMAEQFLRWKLPATFNPDCGISFKAEYNVEYNAQQGRPPARHEPTGTNLFDYTQAAAMVRHMIEGLPAGDGSPTAWIEWTQFNLLDVGNDELIDVRTLDGYTYLGQPYFNFRSNPNIIAWRRAPTESSGQ